ncbi:putative glycosyltransferase EpsJ [termite gut metagenome]|uniref:Putative glycosyltransferase EpsJ n=1 Tax=termite gut metagenome TaxID=433724 RepID=A0A5J4PV73_9ZZZZ
MLTTVFTPTYNRESYLKILFNSLQEQTNKNFEWILVDDGSTDNTSEIADEIKRKANFSFHYYKKENGGKHTAINLAMKYAKGEMFFCVDSDDYLGSNAIKMINEYYPQIKDSDKICAVTFLRHHHDGTPMGTQKNPTNLVTNFQAYRFQYGIEGERAEVVKTEILRNYPFPVFGNEKLCTEGVVWNRIAKKYDSLYIANVEPIYFCEYLPDGLTKGGVFCPQSYMVYYNELTTFPMNVWEKIKIFSSYWYQSFLAKYTIYKAYKNLICKWGLIAYPLGVYLYLKIYIDNLIRRH